MVYALILTVLLGTAGNSLPIQTQILFETEKECEKALKTATFVSPIPHVSASAVCVPRKST